MQLEKKYSMNYEIDSGNVNGINHLEKLDQVENLSRLYCEMNDKYL